MIKKKKKKPMILMALVICPYEFKNDMPTNILIKPKKDIYPTEQINGIIKKEIIGKAS
jgi:hypothetical protein